MTGAVLTGLPPLVSGQTRLLILGSFPGAASLAARQYYGHPQNQFWKILQAIWPDSPDIMGADSYQIRSEWLLSKGLGVWDVYAACEREGSLDSRIRRPVVNDFSLLRHRCPQLQAIAHNGGESFRHAKFVMLALSAAGPPQGAKAPSGSSAAREAASVVPQFYRLPSTSPANASWSFERKLGVWRGVFETHGLI
ncbi:DNA-deoxyinosine glycosylase [Polaromonas sp.]|uniref:DNA-deoxyinosine glycosylase n=1 Tax=Polaromonas sp. TaxID=1869339 RepID=UPI00286B0B81|nr:DNA-deoxyinosine glycosylase [Polaromonas sp.]